MYDDDKVTVISNDPWLITIDDFLSADECERLIAMGHRIGYEPSVGRVSRNSDNDHQVQQDRISTRTSQTAWCHFDYVLRKR